MSQGHTHLANTLHKFLSLNFVFLMCAWKRRETTFNHIHLNYMTFLLCRVIATLLITCCFAIKADYGIAFYGVFILYLHCFQ